MLPPKVPCASALSSVWLALIPSSGVGVGVGLAVGVGVGDKVGDGVGVIGAKVTPIPGVGVGVGDKVGSGIGVGVDGKVGS